MFNYSILNLLSIIKKNKIIILIFIIVPAIIGLSAGNQSFDVLIEKALGLYTKENITDRFSHALNVLVPFFLGINIFITRYKYETSLILLRDKSKQIFYYKFIMLYISIAVLKIIQYSLFSFYNINNISLFITIFIKDYLYTLLFVNLALFLLVLSKITNNVFLYILGIIYFIINIDVLSYNYFIIIIFLTLICLFMLILEKIKMKKIIESL